MSKAQPLRCFGTGKDYYEDYHDNEWGVPVYDDNKLFEMLILEGAQAGLSWDTILKKRSGYNQAFYNFDVKKVANMQQKELESLYSCPDIVKNKLKINSVKNNALIFINIQKEFGTFCDYIWGFTNNEIIKGNWKKVEDIPVSTDLSDKVAKDLKKRGMKFVGTTIIYSYLQAIGIVDDHIVSCCRYNA